METDTLLHSVQYDMHASEIRTVGLLTLDLGELELLKMRQTTKAINNQAARGSAEREWG
jgi:hypothetical protein